MAGILSEGWLFAEGAGIGPVLRSAGGPTPVHPPSLAGRDTTRAALPAGPGTLEVAGTEGRRGPRFSSFTI